ncbi:MAG: histidine triad nucleotide-binding protein [bacterium]
MYNTIFGKIINKEIPADIVYEDDFVLAFNDIAPQAPIHIIIIPKKEIPTINDIAPADSEIVAKMVLTAQKIAKDKAIDQSGYRIVMNCNEHGQQTVFHLHIHLLGGRQMNWPPG